MASLHRAKTTATSSTSAQADASPSQPSMDRSDRKDHYAESSLDYRFPGFNYWSLPSIDRPSIALTPPSSSEQYLTTWSTADDGLLMRYRKQGLDWGPIAERFPGKTPNNCRKRHERLMERQSNHEWDSIKTEDLAAGYFECREQMWKIMAEYLGGTNWETLEAKCMEKGLKCLRVATQGVHRGSGRDSALGSEEFDASVLGSLSPHRRTPSHIILPPPREGTHASPAPQQSLPPLSQYVWSHAQATPHQVYIPPMTGVAAHMQKPQRPQVLSTTAAYAAPEPHEEPLACPTQQSLTQYAWSDAQAAEDTLYRSDFVSEPTDHYNSHSSYGNALPSLNSCSSYRMDVDYTSSTSRRSYDMPPSYNTSDWSWSMPDLTWSESPGFIGRYPPLDVGLGYSTSYSSYNMVPDYSTSNSSYSMAPAHSTSSSAASKSHQSLQGLTNPSNTTGKRIYSHRLPPNYPSSIHPHQSTLISEDRETEVTGDPSSSEQDSKTKVPTKSDAPNAKLPVKKNSPAGDTLSSQDHTTQLSGTSATETPKSSSVSRYQTTPETLTDGADGTSPPYSELSSLTTTRELNAVAQKLILDLVGRIVPKCVKLSKDQINSYTEPNSGSSTSTQQQWSGLTPATSYSGSLKRRRQNDEEDGDECQDGDENGHKAKKANRTISKKVKLWACPYTKFDPIRYSEHNQQDEKGYRKCASATLMNISTVKQHLRRVHLEPKYYCGNCFESFKEKKDLLQHNQIPCRKEAPRYQEMMTEEQYQQIPRYLADTVSSWNQIFRILFKDTPLPASPYVSHCNTAVLEQFIVLFRYVGPNEFLRLLGARPRPNDLLLESNLSLRNLIEETYQSAFPEYLQQLRALTNENTTSEDRSIVIQNPQLSTPQNSDSQILGTSTNTQSTASGSWDAVDNAEAQEWMPALSNIDEVFTSFTENLYTESCFDDNESWTNDFSAAFGDASKQS